MASDRTSRPVDEPSDQRIAEDDSAGAQGHLDTRLAPRISAAGNLRTTLEEPPPVASPVVPLDRGRARPSSAGNSTDLDEQFGKDYSPLNDTNARPAGNPDRPPEPGSQEPADPHRASIDVSENQIRLSLEDRITYRTLKLEEPPRFVVDIEGGVPADVVIPAIEGHRFLNAMRVGSPDDSGRPTRIVLDLKEAQTAVVDQPSPDGRSLALVFGAAGVAGKVVVLDAGHGGSDPGAQRGDIREKDLTLEITARLKQSLEQKGVKTVMTRGDDTYVTLEDRVRVTNDTRPDAFVSIHINSLETNNSIQGIETYYQTDQSRPLAETVHQSLVQALGVPDRSVRKARFYVVNHTPHPAILAEVGFISNKQERDKLISSDYQDKIADAVGKGIILFLAKDPAGPGQTIGSGPAPAPAAAPAAAPSLSRIAEKPPASQANQSQARSKSPSRKGQAASAPGKSRKATGRRK